MKARILKIGILCTAGGILTFLAIIACYWVAERYYFDKLFYRKSALHGYGETEWLSPELDTNPTLKKRKADLAFLLSSSENKNSNVLGMTTDSNQDDAFEIAVIGDSMAYGTGILEKETFSALLEDKLGATHSVNVYNFSLPGDHLLDNYAKYLAVKEKINPDLYIFGVVTNDLLIDYIGKYNNEEIKQEFDSTCMGVELPENKKIDWKNMTDIDMNLKLFFPTLLDGTCNIHYLEQVLSKLEVDKDKIIFMSYSPLDKYNIYTSDQEFLEKKWSTPQEESNQKENFVLSKFKFIITKHGYTFIEPSHEYDRVSPKEGHPSAKAHRNYADVLFSYISSNYFK